METIEGWEDVTPVPQDEFENPVSVITYPESYSTAMGYLRAAISAGETSERGLQLTESIIDQNPAHYSTWHYRRCCLFALDKALFDELEYVRDVALENPKNYQLWYHRRLVAEKYGDGTYEIPFVDEILSMDSKNYHAWAHRQWVVSYFDYWEGELDATEKYIREDFRNNSAWNHRWFIIHGAASRQRIDQQKPVPSEVVSEEIQFTFSQIEKAVNNESAWNYLRGYVEEGGFANFPEVKSTCESLLAEDENAKFCIPLHNLLAEMYEEDAENEDRSFERCMQLLQALKNEVDTSKEKYWDRRIKRLLKRSPT